MNYKQYQQLKKRCELKVKLYSVSVYIIALLSVMQTALLVMKIDKTYRYINILLIEQLYSMGYVRYTSGNIVFGMCFYGAFALVVLSFIVSAFFCLGNKKWPYVLTLFLYLIDAMLCLFTASYVAFLIHVVLIIFVILALKNQHNLNLLKNNIWGYR